MNTIKLKTIAAALGALCLCASVAAQTYPLSESFWSSPEFQARVMGSYGTHTELEPRLSEEEGQLFKGLVAVLDADLRAGERALAGAILPASSAALDFMLGTIRMQLGEPRPAIAAYETAIRKFPNFMRAYKNLGIAHIQSDELDKGVAMLVKGIELGGGDGLSYGLLGYAYLNLGKSSSALSAYELAIVLDPAAKDWKLGKLRCLVELEEHDRAAGLIKELIASEPQQHELYLHQANISLARERPQEALADLEIVRRMGKATEESLFLLADICANRGMSVLALAVYEDALARSSSKASRFPRVQRAARAYIEREAWDDARALLDLATKSFADALDKDDRLALLNLAAEVELGADNAPAAAEKLERIIEEDPMNGSALLLLARHAREQGDLEDAAFLFERAATIDSVRSRALLQHGQMLVQRREYAEAAKLIRASLDLEFQSNVADYLASVEQAAQQL